MFSSPKGNTDDTGSIVAVTSLTDLSPGDRPWETHRAAADRVESAYRAGDYERLAERIAHCGQTLTFGAIAGDGSPSRLKLKNARYCRVRLCPVCQWRRSLKWRARFLGAIPTITQRYPTHRWVFLTLTIRNCQIEELRSTVEELNAGWQRLTKRKEFPAIGTIRSLEVTRGTDGTAHPHFHCLLLVPPGYFSGKNYLKHERWRALWQECLRVDYAPQVRVQAVKGNSMQAVCETLKYSVKPDDLQHDRDWLLELTKQLHKTRAVATGGVLRELIRDVTDSDDYSNIDDDPTLMEYGDLHLIFDWWGNTQRYLLRHAE